MTKFKLVLLIVMFGCVALSGCQQGRYQPAKWRPAIETDTLPVMSEVSGESSTLPLRQSTLPSRQSTLPSRQSTLPIRVTESSRSRVIWDTAKKEKFYSPKTSERQEGTAQWAPAYRTSTLPGRTGTLPMRNSTLPGRTGLIGGMAGRVPDHLEPLRRQSTLPMRKIRRYGTLPTR